MGTIKGHLPTHTWAQIKDYPRAPPSQALHRLNIEALIEGSVRGVPQEHSCDRKVLHGI